MKSSNVIKSKRKVVVIGGGTGTYQVLIGLKKYPLNLTAVVSMCDSGGSTGMMRKELGILPPGDVRRAILALSDLPFAQRTLEELFDFRFKDGKNLRDQSVGNILLAALTQITGSMDKAIDEAARILRTTGSVFPITLDNTNLVAILADGTRIFGETGIDKRKKKLNLPIKKVYLTPKAVVYKKAADAITNAELIIFAPGDLYTSTIPTLLVGGVTELLANSNAKIVYVVNLMTKREETKDFTANDFINEMDKYLGVAGTKLSYVIINKWSNRQKSKIARWYKKYDSIPVKNDFGKNKHFRIIEKDFLSKTTLFRHDPDKLAKTLINIGY